MRRSLSGHCYVSSQWYLNNHRTMTGNSARHRNRRLPMVALCAAILSIAGPGLAADGGAGAPAGLVHQPIEALLRVVEQRVAADHTSSPAGDSAIDAWKLVLQAIPSTDPVRASSALTIFSVHMRRRAAEEQRAGNITVSEDMAVFASQAEHSKAKLVVPPQASGAQGGAGEAAAPAVTPGSPTGGGAATVAGLPSGGAVGVKPGPAVGGGAPASIAGAGAAPAVRPGPPVGGVGGANQAAPAGPPPAAGASAAQAVRPGPPTSGLSAATQAAPAGTASGAGTAPPARPGPPVGGGGAAAQASIAGQPPAAGAGTAPPVAGAGTATQAAIAEPGPAGAGAMQAARPEPAPAGEPTLEPPKFVPLAGSLPPVAVPPSPTPAKPPMAEFYAWRGDLMLAKKDISAARKYYELAANAGSARAALQLSRIDDLIATAQPSAEPAAQPPGRPPHRRTRRARLQTPSIDAGVIY